MAKGNRLAQRLFAAAGLLELARHNVAFKAKETGSSKLGRAIEDLEQAIATMLDVGTALSGRSMNQQNHKMLIGTARLPCAVKEVRAKTSRSALMAAPCMGRRHGSGARSPTLGAFLMRLTKQDALTWSGNGTHAN